MSVSQEIELILKNSIDILRGDPYFSGKYGNYILQILFFKYLSELYEASNYINNVTINNITISKDVSWLALENIKQNLGKKITEIFHSLEKDNPSLKGVFINPEINQWERISDNTLLQLIQYLSIINLHKSILQKPEVLGDIYEELMVNSTLHEFKYSVNYFTPRCITTLMVNLIKPQAHMKIFDPACGSGGMLIECIRYLKNEFKEDHEFLTYGQEEDYELRSIAKINLFLYGIYNHKILSGNIIHNPPLDENGNLQKFDIVITNPPFGVKNWLYSKDKRDFDYNFQYGKPPKSSADYAFIQYILTTLEDTGKAAIIVPHGVLFRGGIEGEIRKNIVKSDVIEAIIGLPENLFSNTKIPTVIIVFNKNKNNNSKDKILFIDASHEYKYTQKHNSLTNKHISNIVSIYLNFQEKHEYSKITSHKEIADYSYILDINHFVKHKKQVKILEVDSQVKTVKMLENQRSIIESQMDECLKRLGIEI